MASKELENLLSKMEEYRGKHVVVIEDEIIAVKSGSELKDTVERLERKYPGKTPLITFVPQEEVIIL